ncbi:MAG: hypothetical protein FDX21_05240 [Chlorobium sp.]|nr:MAG: hypothetical protein FDX21_05240 [Chlorobium sp.]
MAEIQPEKMKGTTLNIAAENRARLKQLFPTVFTETRNEKGELFSVSDGALLLCLEESVTKELIDAVIELNPQQFLCLDSAFHGNDQLKANAVQTFNAHNMQKEKRNQILFKTV